MPAERCAPRPLSLGGLTGPLFVCGGVYSNHHALRAFLEECKRGKASRIFCLGDLGGFGPHPDRVFPLLEQNGVTTLRGNYEDSIGRELGDCQCGYTDPRDNWFAQISYRYTLRNTSPRWRAWMRGLPGAIRFEFSGRRVLACHGSPRKTNEFIWDSTSSDAFLLRLLDRHDADVVLATHTGLPWVRELPGGRLWVNVGVLGRPANDGTQEVRYATLEECAGGPRARLHRLSYDHEALAAEMEAEQLPVEFVETVRTGWWTTCLEILPVRERLRGRY